MPIPVRLRINNTPREHVIEPRVLLVHYLRDFCNLTGTHVGCETGICGACTVLVDRRAGRRRRGDDDREPGGERSSASGAAGFLGAPRSAVRILHARHDHGERARTFARDAIELIDVD